MSFGFDLGFIHFVFDSLTLSLVCLTLSNFATKLFDSFDAVRAVVFVCIPTDSKLSR